MVDRQGVPDSFEDKMFIGLGLLAASVAVAAVWLGNPALVFQVEARGQEALSFADNETSSFLTVSKEDAGFMNRVYRERTHEVGYCGLVVDGELRPWLGDTINASRGSLVFSTANCPFEPDALIHTHPSGSLSLSDVDKETLRDSSLDYSCVHGGPIPSESGVEAVNLQCYEKLGDGGFDVVDVRVS